MLDELDGDSVKRTLDGGPQGYQAPIGIVAVDELLFLDHEAVGIIVQDVAGIPAHLQSRTVDHHRLKGRAGLAQGVGGPVEAPDLVDVSAADHHQNLAVFHIGYYHSRLDDFALAFDFGELLIVGINLFSFGLGNRIQSGVNTVTAGIHADGVGLVNAQNSAGFIERIVQEGLVGKIPVFHAAGGFDYV
ncbi:hypothetical protein SDC9_192533 [bioreactor metagenome]|uniref:Uncharacterized protein n=1 Tax=bioreactor metagenome TaxID=1076179 RepID=A0A645I292_9ZZZZ